MVYKQNLFKCSIPLFTDDPSVLLHIYHYHLQIGFRLGIDILQKCTKKEMIHLIRLDEDKNNFQDSGGAVKMGTYIVHGRWI